MKKVPANPLRIVATTRPNFLVLTPCCLAIPIALLIADRVPIGFINLLLLLCGALAAHISVNMFNEFDDFSSGLDLMTQRTRFSGGSGTLPHLPELAPRVKTGAFVSLAVTVIIGVYFLIHAGWRLLPIGLTGVLLIYFYTRKITHHPLLCLIAPGLAFGPLMACGAYFALSGTFSVPVFSSSWIMFLLVNNLLLLNQFPDIEADRASGRRHIPIVIGRARAGWVYSGFLILAYIALVTNIWLGYLPAQSAIGLATLWIAVPIIALLPKSVNPGERLKPLLAWNVAVTLITPVLVATGILIKLAL